MLGRRWCVQLFRIAASNGRGLTTCRKQGFASVAGSGILPRCDRDEASRVREGLVTITHYNVLARSYGSNLLPWFLYGANPPVTREQRQKLEELRCKIDETGNRLHTPLEVHARSVLSSEQVSQLQQYDERFFAWEERKWKLVDKIMENDPDIVTLAECEEYHEFFKGQLQRRGRLESTWIQRPGHKDGSCIAWKSSRYVLRGRRDVKFTETDSTGKSRFDSRAAVMVHLEERLTGNACVVITSHLAKLPEDLKFEWSRAREIIQLAVSLNDFVREQEIPSSAAMILAGDLNCLNIKKLTSVSNVVTWLCGTEAHKFFYNPTVIETYATSTTLLRSVQIDYIAYARGLLSVKSVHPIPATSEPMPNADSPSDHFPVTVTFQQRTLSAFRAYCTRKYLENLAAHCEGRQMEHLSKEELKAAFKFCCHAADSQEGTVDFSDQKLFQFLKEEGLDPTALTSIDGSHLSTEQTDLPGEKLSTTVDFARFAKLYYHLEALHDVPSLEIYEQVFEFFDLDDSDLLDECEIKGAIERVSGKPVNDARYAELMRVIDANKDGAVSKEEFLSWVAKLHKRLHLMT